MATQKKRKMTAPNPSLFTNYRRISYSLCTMVKYQIQNARKKRLDQRKIDWNKKMHKIPVGWMSILLRYLQKVGQ